MIELIAQTVVIALAGWFVFGRLARRYLSGRNKWSPSRHCSYLNTRYGGDWYYDKKQGVFCDAFTTRFIRKSDL